LPLTKDEWIDTIRRFPRSDLDQQAARRMLDALRQAAIAEERSKFRRRGWRAAAVFLIVAACLLMIAQIPNLAAKTERALAHWFHPTPVKPVQVWNPSPKFDLLDRDGRVVYPDRLRGIEGKIGYSENFFDMVAQSRESVAKIFWYVWDDSASKDRALKHLVATAVNLDTGKRFELDRTALQGPIYGADAHGLTSFQPFPAKGMWRVDITIDGEPYGQIVVPVKDVYIQTDSIRFLVSKDDAVVGDTEAWLIVNGGNLADTMNVKVTSMIDKRQTRLLTFRKSGEFRDSSTLKPITQYQGTLTFDYAGKWRIEAIGESTIVTVR